MQTFPRPCCFVEYFELSNTTNNCVPACLSCNGDKSDNEAFHWYRSQKFYDPRRAMAIRAWKEGDFSLAVRLLQWVKPGILKRSLNTKKEDAINLRAA